MLLVLIVALESPPPPCCEFRALVMCKTDCTKFIMKFVVIHALKYTERICQLTNGFGVEECDFFFEFKADGKLQLTNFPDEPLNGWEIIPLVTPAIIEKRNVIDFTESKNTSPPNITIAIQPNYNKGSVNDIVSHRLKVEGTDIDSEDRQITINKSYTELTTQGTQSLYIPSSGAQPTPSGQVDLNQLIQTINEVLRSQHANLTRLPTSSLQLLAGQLYALELVGETVKGNPSIDECIGEFKASLNFVTDQQEVQTQCCKLLKAFTAVGGSYSMAANVLRNNLIKAVNDKLNCDFCIDLN